VRISSRTAASSMRSRRSRDTLDLPSFAIATDCSSSLTSADAACKATPRLVKRTILARVSVESGYLLDIAASFQFPNQLTNSLFGDSGSLRQGAGTGAGRIEQRHEA
jgi:hypothetical protein